MGDEGSPSLPTPSHSRYDHVAKIVSEVAKIPRTTSIQYSRPLPNQINRGRQTHIATLRPERFLSKFDFALHAFAIFASVTHVRAPTSAEGLQCGVDALSIALRAALQDQHVTTGFPTKEDLRNIILQAANAEEFVAIPTSWYDQDLLRTPDRNFSYDQLAVAVAGYGFAIGIVALHSGEGGQNLVFAEDQRTNKGDAKNVLWLINECGHWEALVPEHTYDKSADEIEVVLKYHEHDAGGGD